MNTKTNASGQTEDVFKAAFARSMGDEIDLQKAGIARVRERRRLYGPLQLPAHRSQEIKARGDLQGLLMSSGLQFRYAKDPELKQIYWRIVRSLNVQYKDTTQRTVSEYITFCQLRGRTRLQILRSLWIGNVNVDFFVPAIKFDGGIGLVIEVDGTIHDREMKGRKDSSKLEYLHQLGIAVQVIENCDARNPNAVLEKAFRDLRYHHRGCSRARKLLWRRIYLETLFCHASNERLKDLFGYELLT